MNQKLTLTTHDGTFHLDDIFAMATLQLFLEKEGKEYNVTRTRDRELITKSDYVLDVGGVYDHEKRHYDHHQKGGAGEHDSGVPYAAFGLIWKHYGLSLCGGSTEIWNSVEESLVESVDAPDNGVELLVGGEYPFDRYPKYIHSFFISFRPTWSQKQIDEEKYALLGFEKAVSYAKEMLVNTIIHIRESGEIRERIFQELSTQVGPIRTLSENAHFSSTLDVVSDHEEFREVLYVVYPSSDSWKLVAARTRPGSFDSKKPLPESWRGVKDDVISTITGVESAQFCHKMGFLAGAHTRDGALSLAKLALDA